MGVEREESAWTQAEEKILAKEHRSSIPLEEIASRHRRSTSSIREKLCALGITSASALGDGVDGAQAVDGNNLNAASRESNEAKQLLLSRIKDNLTDIENRSDLSDDQKASRIIRLFSASCAAIAIQPIPFGDIFVLTPVQAYMAERLAAIRGVPMGEGLALDILYDLLKVIGLGMLGQQVALGLYKVGLPFLAGFTTIPLVYGITYGIGNVLDYMFIQRAKGMRVDPEQLKAMFKKKKEEGRKKGVEQKSEILKQARQETDAT